ncbi:activating transcription factor 7 interacting protein 2 isoform X2 [Amia ocellicauda]|uniref:activating transcription factor 7 interacting protein 2 isoform X2 n=1 Tax=Amia ocellicauda TaxID=2972642 RepID=UPI003464A6F0
MDGSEGPRKICRARKTMPASSRGQLDVLGKPTNPNIKPENESIVISSNQKHMHTFTDVFCHSNCNKSALEQTADVGSRSAMTSTGMDVSFKAKTACSSQFLGHHLDSQVHVWSTNTLESCKSDHKAQAFTKEADFNYNFVSTSEMENVVPILERIAASSHLGKVMMNNRRTMNGSTHTAFSVDCNTDTHSKDDAVMTKRKRCHSESTSCKRPRTSQAENKESTLDQRISIQIQELIKQETLAMVKQSENKMQELLERIQRVNCSHKHEIMVNNMQAQINKLKRRIQVVLSSVTRVRPEASKDPPVLDKVVPDPSNPATPKPRDTAASPPCVLDSSGLTTDIVLSMQSPASDTRTSEAQNVAAMSSTSAATANRDSSCEPILRSRCVADPRHSEKENEVVFCGVLMPSKRNAGSVVPNRVSVLRNLGVVDLTSETEAAVGSTPPEPVPASIPEVTEKPQVRSQNSVDRQEPEAPVPTDFAPEAVPCKSSQSGKSLPEAPCGFGVERNVAQPIPAQNAVCPENTASSCTKTVQSIHQPVKDAICSAPKESPQPTPPCNVEVNAADSTVTHIIPGQDPKFPPLPATSFPPNLPPIAATTNLPQKLELKVARIKNPKGIGILWNVAQMDPNAAPMHSYYLYVLYENFNGCVSKWKNIGIIAALPLPMACKLTQFASGRRYCFAIVGKDIYGRYGPYSEIQSVSAHEP